MLVVLMTFTQHWKLAYIKLLYGEWRGADALQRLLKETNFETNEALMFSWIQRGRDRHSGRGARTNETTNNYQKMTVVLFTQQLVLLGDNPHPRWPCTCADYVTRIASQPKLAIRAGETVVGYIDDVRIDGNKVLGTFHTTKE